MLKRPKWMRKSPALYHPILLLLIIQIRRLERWTIWTFDRERYSQKREKENLPFRVKKHQSVLIRKLSSPKEQQLQINKVDNLKAVIRELDGITIQPNETFSFCKLVGKPTKKRGFKEGMELSRGEAQSGIGGGICQSSNLIYWLVLHSPLKVIERHHHSFDPFPDQGRVLPFASGATVMYNYRDLQFKNSTNKTYQLNLWLDKKCLNGELRVSSELPHSYKVYEKNHHFEAVGDNYFRSNELWKKTIDRRTGKTVQDEHIVSNYAEVKYIPSPDKLHSTTSIEV